MCELFGVTTSRSISVNEMLTTFFSHSKDQPNGWGYVRLDEKPYRIEKEPVMALNSPLVKDILQKPIETTKCIAHIRKATIGNMELENTHPFIKKDASGRIWVFAHNGTIFESKKLSPYQYVQQGTTDSERIFLYLIDMLNNRYEKVGRPLDDKERFKLVEKVLIDIVPGNKVNFLLYDGDLFYVHKNEADTLFKKKTSKGVIFATQPLGQDGWTAFPQNQVIAYRDGEKVYEGKKHPYNYIYDDEQMKLLYRDYSGL